MVNPLYERAEGLVSRRDFPAARLALEAVIADDPTHLMARLRLSTLATSQGRLREATTQLLAIAALDPSEPELLVLVAGMLHRLGEVQAALRCLSSPAMSARLDQDVLEEAAQLASQMDDPALAGALLDRAASAGALSPAALYTRATVALFVGQLDAAERSLEACLSAAPDFMQAHWALSRLRKQTTGANHVGRLSARLAAHPSGAGTPHLGFALFKELDDLDRTDEAWAALQAGCRAKRQRLDYRVDDEIAAFSALARVTGQGVPEDAVADAGPAPIFIVGMPRTGTTLLERILSAHPDVHDAGELDEFPLQMRWMANRFSKSFLDAAVIAAQVPGDAYLLGKRYLAHAAWRAHGKPRFTDKLPLNFLQVGLIARSLPGARILHMVRNPMDTCFSNLKELFAEAYPYSYDLGELAAHYGRYRRLMVHWHEQFPGCVLDVGYEQLVTDPEAESRRVLAFCGLAWDPSVLQVESRQGAVSTASSVQVREPIHRRSVAGWQRYARHLEPLRKLLRADGWMEA